MNLTAVQPMTPRQISLLAGNNGGFCGAAGTQTTVHAIDAPHAHATTKFRRTLRKQAERCGSHDHTLTPALSLNTYICSARTENR